MISTALLFSNSVRVLNSDHITRVSCTRTYVRSVSEKTERPLSQLRPASATEERENFKQTRRDLTRWEMFFK